MRGKPLLLPALIVTLIAVVAGAAIAYACSDTTNLLHYQFDLVDIKDNGNHTSTWTYAVTSSGDEDHGLSHWTLGIGSCYNPITTPTTGSNFTTLTSSAYGCGSKYHCEEAHCTATLGKDSTTGITGIKFESCSPQLSKEKTKTQIFQFTVSAVPDQPGEVQVGAKAGSTSVKGNILGPSCSPTAVALRDLSARPDTSSGASGRAFLFLAMALGAAGILITHRITHQ